MKISQYVAKFNETLYNADSLIQENTAVFSKGHKPDIKKTDDNFKLICDLWVL